MSCSKKIDPYCKKDYLPFIECTGLVAPCCWLLTNKSKEDALKDFLGEDFNRIHISNDWSDIQAAYKTLEDSWETDTPFKTCLHVCGTGSDTHPELRKSDGIQ